MKTLLTLITLSFALQAFPCDNSNKLLPYVQRQVKKQVATKDDISSILNCVLTDPDYSTDEWGSYLGEVIFDMAIYQPHEYLFVADLLDDSTLHYLVDMMKQPVNKKIDLKAALYGVLQVQFETESASQLQTKLMMADAIYEAITR